VLVHPRVVLTAAHCHQPPGITSNVVALNTLDKDRMGVNTEIIRARMAVTHPDYLVTGFHDICVLILQQPATTRPVRVAKTDEIAAASTTTLVGFGNDNLESTRGFGIQRKVRVDIISLRRAPSDDLDADERRFNFESDLEFVAGGSGFDTCNGDSGGPAYINVGGSLRVAGWTSRGFRQSTVPCGEGGIYTRVDSNIDFVQRVMHSNGLDPGEL
jgi:endonuclease G